MPSLQVATQVANLAKHARCVTATLPMIVRQVGLLASETPLLGHPTRLEPRLLPGCTDKLPCVLGCNMQAPPCPLNDFQGSQYHHHLL